MTLPRGCTYLNIELFCLCGSRLNFVGPPEEAATMERVWQELHPEGPSHHACDREAWWEMLDAFRGRG